MVGRLELDAVGHGDVGVGVAVVHAGTAVDLVHGVTEAVKKGLVDGVGGVFST